MTKKFRFRREEGGLKGTSVIHSLVVIFSSQKYLNIEILKLNNTASKAKRRHLKKIDL
jgi:hypothetical protein